MAIILNIETSTDICSVSVAKEGECLVLKETPREYSHSEVIGRFVKEAIAQSELSMNDLEAISIAGGPGSYTGLRIGSSMAKGLCFGLNIPLIVIPTLKALAYGIKDEVAQGEIIIPLIDARRMEVYCAVFDDHVNAIKKIEAKIIDKNTFEAYIKYPKVHFCGDGAIKTREILGLPNAIFHDSFCSAKPMAALSEKKFQKNEWTDPMEFEPYYHKAPNITTQKKNILINGT